MELRITNDRAAMRKRFESRVGRFQLFSQCQDRCTNCEKYPNVSKHLDRSVQIPFHGNVTLESKVSDSERIINELEPRIRRAKNRIRRKPPLRSYKREVSERQFSVKNEGKKNTVAGPRVQGQKRTTGPDPGSLIRRTAYRAQLSDGN